VSSLRLGVLAACTSAPQVVTAPWLGARLDRATRPAVVLAFLVAVLGVGVGLVGTGLGRAPFLAVLAVAVMWSVAEPAVMGGLSGVASRSAAGDGRIETADAVSYGVAAIAGQGLVAGVVLFASPVAIVAVLVALGTIGAAAVARLPLLGASSRSTGDRPFRAGIAALVGDPELRAVTVLTTISMSAFGGLALAAVGIAERHGRPPAAGAALVLALACGAVPGAMLARRLGATARPLAAAFVSVAVVGRAFAFAFGPWWLGFVGFALAGFADGPLLAATFASRTARTPPDLRASVYTIAAGAKIAGTAVGAVVVGAVIDGRPRAGITILVAFQLVALVAGAAALRRG